MPKFSYVATTSSGELSRGIERAVSREAAELALYEKELRDIQVTPVRSLLKLELTAPRVKRDELMHLSRQLGAFIRSGLPLIDAVHMIGKESSNSSVRGIMTDVEDGLRGGETLSSCFDRHPKTFPAYYRGILHSAELTGELDTVLEQLAIYLERDLEAGRKIKSALTYPAVIVVMAIATVVVLASFVLPRFKTFFAGLHAKLPLPTRMLLACTDFLTNYWWVILGGTAISSLVILLVLRTEGGRRGRDRILLGTPVLGSTIQYALVERFSRILSSMVNAGVDLPEALRVSTDATHNRIFVEELSVVRTAVLEGEGLARPLARSGLFPNTAAMMIQVGEDTGTLDDQLEVTARYYEGELNYKIKKVTSLFEPAVIIVMGALVGFVAIALVSAMYGIFNQVKV